MARLRDVPMVMKHVGVLTFLKRLWQQVSEDNMFTWAAALAYSWLFALFPFVVFLLSLVPLIPERYKPDMEAEVGRFVQTSMPENAGSIVMDQVRSVLSKPSAGGFLSFGLIFAVWAASGGMAMTMGALDKAYDIDQGRSYIGQRLVAIGLTIIVAILVIAVMVLLPIGAGVIEWLISQGRIFGWLSVILDIARYAVALVLLFAVLALIYYFGPSFKQKFHAITPGAVFCIAVWLLLGYGFQLYLSYFGGAESYNKTYGAVAGVAILLLLFYVDALVLLAGAEINSEIDFIVLGVPSGGTPEQQVIAPTKTAEEPEQKALAEELQHRRKHDAAPPAPAPPPEPVGREKPSSRTVQAILVLAGVWAASLLAKHLRQGQSQPPPDPRPEPQRLRDTYPGTYAALTHDQHDGRTE